MEWDFWSTHPPSLSSCIYSTGNSSHLMEYWRLYILDNVIVKSCKTCAKVRVCIVYKTIKNLYRMQFERMQIPSRPFEIDRLAEICDEYLGQNKALVNSAKVLE